MVISKDRGSMVKGRIGSDCSMDHFMGLSMPPADSFDPENQTFFGQSSLSGGVWQGHPSLHAKRMMIAIDLSTSRIGPALACNETVCIA